MFKKILIANRGEIAVRIARACRELGIRTVAVFSDVDRPAMHVAIADEAYPLRGNSPSETYLHQERIIEIARRSHADAIHPGYGFLSENPEFARVVAAAGITFIGPPHNVIRELGDKTSARKIADQLKIPTVPGTKDPLTSEKEALAIAAEIGYPILLKAAAGGGGKGMRVVKSAEELPGALQRAKSEAANAFGDDRVYIEKLISGPRHVEIQILSDSHGNAVYLGERECSIQRRHQKLVEESPSPALDEGLRQAMGDAALRLAKSVGYVNAGTVEFLVDEKQNYYFLEVNTRLQVEHPVTEMVTGIDLVHQQIMVAAGQPLSFSQQNIVKRGHAIECRVCAEDPAENFLPSTGTLTRYSAPHGPKVRVDTALRRGDQVTIFYDPLMAKVIAWGEDRDAAISTMHRALSEFAITGVTSTIPLSMYVLAHPGFRSGNYDTSFITTQFEPRVLKPTPGQLEIAAAISVVLLRSTVSQANAQDTNPNGAQSTWKKCRQESYR